MKNQITKGDLQALVNIINHVMGTPATMFPTGKATDGMAEGHYHLDYTNGGVALEQVGKVHRYGQGCRNVFECGHAPKRELYGLMKAYIDGLRDYRAMIQTEV